MLSYRHGFHAGNHADVLKHWLCVLVSQYMGQKDKPFLYIDSHAGAGVYSLKSSVSKKTKEAEAGIEAIWQQRIPAVMQPYVDLIKTLNDSDELNLYPGSPWFVQKCLREQDKARLFELHPQDFLLLNKNFQTHRNVKVEKEDGFTGLKSLLPPAQKRAMVVIDPPYEQAHEYKLVLASIKDCLKRFANGVYVIWYPLINRNDKQNLSEKMATHLKGVDAKSYLDVRFWVEGKEQTPGMYGSGLMVLNPPWNLAKQLEEGLPFLVKELGVSDQAGYSLDYKEG